MLAPVPQQHCLVRPHGGPEAFFTVEPPELLMVPFFFVFHRALRFATGGSPSGCRGRNATRSGCGFFRSSLQAWHRSTLASVCTGFSRGHTTSVRSTKLSCPQRRQRTSSSSQPPAIASAILCDGSAVRFRE